MRSTTDLRTLKRRFTIITSDYVAAVFASGLTKKLAVLAPDVSLSISPYAREALRQFQRGTIDFLIGPDFALETKHSAELLFEDRFKCVLWKKNSFANTAMTPKDFFNAPMILTNFFLENGKSQFETWLEKQTPEIQVVASLPSSVVLPHFLAGTNNIATIHERLVPLFASQPDLSIVDPPVEIPVLREYLVTTEKHKHDSDAQLLADVMRDVGKEI